MAIKVVIIDPYKLECRDAIIEDSLESYYAEIGCRLIEPAYPDALGGECVYVDEEGLFEQSCGFQLMAHHPLMGRGIVVGTDSQGRSVSTTWRADEVRANIIGWLGEPPEDEG